MHVSEYTFGRKVHVNVTVKCSDLDHESSVGFWLNVTTLIKYCKGEECNVFNDLGSREYNDLNAFELHKEFDVGYMNNSKIYKVSHFGKVKKPFNSFRDF